MNDKIKFSLILCTLNNFTDIKIFVKSLLNYERNMFELIVIDQNDNSISYFFDELINSGFNVKYFHVKFKGLSKSRNFGLKFLSGEYVAFPDDDCIYSDLLLYDVQKLFREDVDFLSINTCDSNNHNQSLISLPKAKEPISFVKRNSVSFTLFFKSESIKRIGFFDENMGVGASTKYGAGEESDYIVRALFLGLRGMYYPHLYVYHPAKESVGVFSTVLKRRMLSYGGGYGYFLRKNFFIQGSGYSIRCIGGVLIRVLKSIKSYVELKMSFYFLIGFVNGFLKR